MRNAYGLGDYVNDVHTTKLASVLMNKKRISPNVLLNMQGTQMFDMNGNLVRKDNASKGVYIVKKGNLSAIINVK